MLTVEFGAIIGILVVIFGVAIVLLAFLDSNRKRRDDNEARVHCYYQEMLRLIMEIECENKETLTIQYQLDQTTQEMRAQLNKNSSEQLSSESLKKPAPKNHHKTSVNMLFTQFNMDDALEVRYEEGYEDGFENGFSGGFKDGAEQGRMLNLIHQVNKKLQKGKDIPQIAEEVEESQELVERICRAIEKAGTDEAAEIYKCMED